MHTDSAKPNSTAISSFSITDTASPTTSSNTATFAVSSVFSSHQAMETSEAFIHPKAENSTTYLLERLTSREENLFDMSEIELDSEQCLTLQQLACANNMQDLEQALPQELDESQHDMGAWVQDIEIWLQGIDSQTKETAISSSAKKTAHNSIFFTNETNLLDVLKIDQQQKDEFLHDLTTALNEIGSDTKNEIKITAVKGLLEGKNKEQIAEECSVITQRHKRIGVAINEPIILAMFEYYRLGGLTLLKGYSYGTVRPLPAKLMHQVLTMYQNRKLKKYRYHHIASAIESEITKNPEYHGLEVTKITISRVRKFLLRCGAISPKKNKRNLSK